MCSLCIRKTLVRSFKILHIARIVLKKKTVKLLPGSILFEQFI